VCALVDHASSALVVGHVGDARAVLCRGGGIALRLTQDHKPHLPAEVKAKLLLLLAVK
jgi:serine/threonine protein phosphatase PrpC